MKYIGIEDIHDAFDSSIDKITEDAFSHVNDEDITDEMLKKIDNTQRELLRKIENAIDQYLGKLGKIIGSQPYSAN